MVDVCGKVKRKLGPHSLGNSSASLAARDVSLGSSAPRFISHSSHVRRQPNAPPLTIPPRYSARRIYAFQLNFIMSATIPPHAPTSPNAIYSALESYPWTSDQEFQAGLTAILGTNSTPEQTTELTLRARCFYYARYGANWTY